MYIFPHDRFGSWLFMSTVNKTGSLSFHLECVFLGAAVPYSGISATTFCAESQLLSFRGSLLLCGALLNWFLILPMNAKKLRNPNFIFSYTQGNRQISKYRSTWGQKVALFTQSLSLNLFRTVLGEKFGRGHSRRSHSLQDEEKIRIFSCFLAGIMAKPKFLHWLHDAPIPLKLPSDGGWIYFMEPLKFCKGFTVFLPFCHSQMPTFALKLQIWDAFLYIKAR